MKIISLFALLLLANVVRGQDCNETFRGALGGFFSDTGLFGTALDISGYADKLPPPSFPITLIIGNNKAWLSMLWHNGFFIPSISKIGSQLPATVLYNVIPTAISPDQIKAAAGTAPTAYGLLKGEDHSLSYWADEQGTIRFLSPFHQDDSAKVVKEAKKVCNSWVYVVDTILYPANKLKEVQGVSIPDNLPWNSQPAPPEQPTAPVEPTAPDAPTIPVCSIPSVAATNSSLAESGSSEDTTATTATTNTIMMDTPSEVTVTENPTNTATTESAPEVCTVSLVDAARASSLNLLSSALAQPALTNLLPNAAMPNTMYAPTDAAFFSLLTKFNLSLATAASSLGGSLSSLILYHITPGVALSVEDINGRAGMETDLGKRLNDPEYAIGVIADTAGTNPTLTGLYPDNKAKIVETKQVCGTTVHIIDNVLIPGSSLDTIPKVDTSAPAPVAPTSTTPEQGTAPAQNGTGVTGNASNIGPLSNCLVKLELPGGVMTAITDTDGKFNFPELIGCALQQAVAWLPAGEEQLDSCFDSATSEKPSFTLTTFIDALTNKDSGSLDQAMLTLSPMVTALTRDLGADNSTDITDVLSAPWVGDLAGLMGLSAPFKMLTSDYFKQAMTGDSDALAVLAGNTATMVTSTLGSELLSNILPDIGIDDAASALLQQLAINMRSNGSLTDAGSIESLLKATLKGLDPTPGSMIGGIAGDVIAEIIPGGNRKMLETTINLAESNTDTPTTTTTGTIDKNEEMFKEVSNTIAFMNNLALQACQAARKNPETLSNSATTTVNRVASVTQQDLAPAVANLASGSGTADEYRTKYSPPNLAVMVYPKVASPVNAPSPSPKPSPSPVPAVVVNAINVGAPAPKSGAVDNGVFAAVVGAVVMALI